MWRQFSFTLDKHNGYLKKKTSDRKNMNYSLQILETQPVGPVAQSV
jgi:hypothetical protein